MQSFLVDIIQAGGGGASRSHTIIVCVWLGSCASPFEQWHRNDTLFWLLFSYVSKRCSVCKYVL